MLCTALPRRLTELGGGEIDMRREEFLDDDTDPRRATLPRRANELGGDSAVPELPRREVVERRLKEEDGLSAKPDMSGDVANVMDSFRSRRGPLPLVRIEPRRCERADGGESSRRASAMAKAVLWSFSSPLPG